MKKISFILSLIFHVDYYKNFHENSVDFIANCSPCFKEQEAYYRIRKRAQNIIHFLSTPNLGR